MLRKKRTSEKTRLYRFVLPPALASEFDEVVKMARKNGWIYDPKPELERAMARSLKEAKEQMGKTEESNAD